jgi:predicted enzyme related to lactoylglutathione lyase
MIWLARPWLAKASEQWKPDPNGGGACLEVADLDQAIAHLKANEFTITMDIQDYPFCRLALIADPDGNTLALHQRKPNHLSSLQSNEQAE